MMKALRLLVVGIVLAAVLMPFAVQADQLPAPLERKLVPGVTTVSYAGQTLRFMTAVPLILRLDPITITQIKITVRSYGSVSGPQGTSGTSLNIFWENWATDIYDGPPPPPSDPWEGIINSESGFTEK
jgi:hypothetical protein